MELTETTCGNFAAEELIEEGLIVKLTGEDVTIPPFAPNVVTVIAAVPAVAISSVVIAACSDVELL